MSGTFTFTGRLMHPDKVTPLADNLVRLAARTYLDAVDHVVYTQGVTLVTEADGSFTTPLLTKTGLTYTVSSSPPAFSPVTFTAPANGTTLDLSTLTGF